MPTSPGARRFVWTRNFNRAEYIAKPAAVVNTGLSNSSGQSLIPTDKQLRDEQTMMY